MNKKIRITRERFELQKALCTGLRGKSEPVWDEDLQMYVCEIEKYDVDAFLREQYEIIEEESKKS